MEQPVEQPVEQPAERPDGCVPTATMAEQATEPEQVRSWMVSLRENTADLGLGMHRLCPATLHVSQAFMGVDAPRTALFRSVLPRRPSSAGAA